jgi:cyclic di-GMP phosphodiesterase Gmr
MQSRTKHDLQSTATQGDIGLAEDSELSILRDVFRMLPTGVTVQDEHGRFLLVNDAAAVQLGITVGEPRRRLRRN